MRLLVKFFFSYPGLALLLVTPVLYYCADEKKSASPENLIPEEKLVKLLADYALAESAMNLNVKNVFPSKTDSAYNFDPLLENGIRKSQYDSTVAYYTSQPGELKKIYDAVLTELTEFESRIPAKADSAAK